MNALLSATGLEYGPRTAPVLRDVSISVAPGEIVTLVGPNGSGKSTLLRLLIGALAPRRGRVHRARGLRIGYVPQSLVLDASLPITVRRFLDLPHRVADADAAAALEQSGATGLEGRQMAALSGGQFQRVLLARAVLNRPQILILDEPTQGLDQPGQAAFYRRIAALRRDLGCAVLMVSHELHVVMSATDRVICLNGHVCCEGTPEVVTAAPAWRELFGTGTGGQLALYRHEHDHAHEAGGAAHHHHHHSHAEG